MLEYDFEKNIGFWLFMTNRALQRAFNEEIVQHGLTYRQMQVLSWLAYEGDHSQADLARKMEIEPASLVPIIDRMERAGWVRREVCPTDRRRNVIRVQPSAEPAWGSIVACAQRVRERAIKGLTAEEHATLLRLLPKVHANLNPEAAITVTKTQPVAASS